MAKTFKRIAALATAIALVVCFAVSASAAINVQTTTQYAGSNQNVNVTVNVSGIEGADYVTYYATKGSKVVYVDQETVSGLGTATIKYQTAATNLNGTVKVGYTDGAATDCEIDGYAVSADKGDVEPAVIPNSGTATVKIAYVPTAAGKTYDSLDVDGATIVGETSFNNNVITVTLSGASKDVEIVVNEKDATESNAVATALDAGYKAVDDTRMITVLGAATGAQECGVIITTNEIASTYATDDAFNAAFTANEKFAAVGTLGQNGVFAVQVIDEGVADEALFVTGTYKVAVYVKNSDGSYTTNAAEDIVVQ